MIFFNELLMIKRKADREAGIFWYNESLIKSPPWTPQCNSAVMHESFQGSLNWAYMMPKDTSLSDSYTYICSSLSLQLQWILTVNPLMPVGNYSYQVFHLLYERLRLSA